MSLQVFAYDFTAVNSDGVTIYYTILTPSSAHKVEVASTPYGQQYIGNINIPSSVTYNGTSYAVTCIGSAAFMGAQGVIGITIPNSVTEIKSHAFMASNITSINIPASVTQIGEGVLANCIALSTVTVASGNTEYDSRNNCNAIVCTSINSLIAGCGTTVIPNSVTGIGNEAFCGLNITSITIPNSVTNIEGSAF